MALKYLKILTLLTQDAATRRCHIPETTVASGQIDKTVHPIFLFIVGHRFQPPSTADARGAYLPRCDSDVMAITVSLRGAACHSFAQTMPSVQAARKSLGLNKSGHRRVMVGSPFYRSGLLT